LQISLGGIKVTVPGSRSALLTPPPLIPITSQAQLDPVPPSHHTASKTLLQGPSQSLTSPTSKTPKRKELRFHSYSGPKQPREDLPFRDQTTDFNSFQQDKVYSSQGQDSTHSSPNKQGTPNQQVTYVKRFYAAPKSLKQQRGQTSPHTYSGPKRVASNHGSFSSDVSISQSSKDCGKNYGSIGSNYKSFADDFPRGKFPPSRDHGKTQSSRDHNRSSVDCRDDSYRSSRNANQRGRNYTSSVDRRESRFSDHRSSRDHTGSPIIIDDQYTSPRDTGNISSDVYKIVAANAVLSGYTPARSGRTLPDYLHR